jgi:hypothetical protein
MAPAVHKFCSDAANAQEQFDALWLEKAKGSDELIEAEKKWARCVAIDWDERSKVHVVRVVSDA